MKSRSGLSPKTILINLGFILIIGACSTPNSRSTQIESPSSTPPGIQENFSTTATAPSIPTNTKAPTASNTLTVTPIITGWACPPPVNPDWGGAGHGDPLFPMWGNGGYHIQHYQIDLTVDIANNFVAGETLLDMVATQPLDAFNLDFLGMDVSRLMVNDQDAVYCRDDMGEMTIIPAKPLSKGETSTVYIAYSGTPMHKIVASQNFLTGWFDEEGAVYSFPSPDNPAFLYPSNEYLSELSTYTIRLTVPEPYRAFTFGSLNETTYKKGLVTTVWNMNQPISGGPFLSIDKYPISKTLSGPNNLPIHLDFPSTLDEASRKEFEVLPELLNFYSSTFGLFPFDALGFNWIQNFPVDGMTLPSRIFINTDPSNIGRFLAHELSHQWFGLSLMPATTKDTWLAEGFATYAEVLWSEHLGKSADDEIIFLYTFMSGSTPPPADPPVDQLYAGSETVYNRPAVALHALRLLVGDEKFFAMIKTFTNRYQHHFVKTSDFIAVAEEVSSQNLEDFFNAWLYKEPVPDIPALKLSKGNGTY